MDMDDASTRGRGGGEPAHPLTTHPATPRQLTFILALGREAGLSEEDLDTAAERTHGVPVAALTRRDASAFIGMLQARRGTSDLAS